VQQGERSPKRLDTTRFSASQQRTTAAVVAELARRTTSVIGLYGDLTIHQQFYAKLATEKFEALVKFYGLSSAVRSTAAVVSFCAPALQ